MDLKFAPKESKTWAPVRPKHSRAGMPGHLKPRGSDASGSAPCHSVPWNSRYAIDREQYFSGETLFNARKGQITSSSGTIRPLKRKAANQNCMKLSMPSSGFWKSTEKNCATHSKDHSVTAKTRIMGM